MRLQDFKSTNNPIAPHYQNFRVAERMLLTGHSHQAWPDCAAQAMQQAFEDAAQFVDEKWERAAQQAEAVRCGYARLLQDVTGEFVLASSTHDLVIRFLSALPLKRRPKLITTDGEFHTLRRQLDRLAEAGLDVIKVPQMPAATVGARLAEPLDDRTAAVLVSAVFFGTAQRAGTLDVLAHACEAREIPLLVDAYHALNVIPFTLDAHGLERAFVVGGGYKYCQMGEGNAFMRIPPGCDMRPVITGWFAEFDGLDQARSTGKVDYPSGPARFAGATYDPVSHYRAARVFRFFAEQGLTVDLLHQINRHQMSVLIQAFDALDADPRLIARDRETALDQLGGFLVLESVHAERFQSALRDRGVLTDCRGTRLRLGPAPYLCDGQLRDAMAALREVIQEDAQRF